MEQHVITSSRCERRMFDISYETYDGICLNPDKIGIKAKNRKQETTESQINEVEDLPSDPSSFASEVIPLCISKKKSTSSEAIESPNVRQSIKRPAFRSSSCSMEPGNNGPTFLNSKSVESKSPILAIKDPILPTPEEQMSLYAEEPEAESGKPNVIALVMVKHSSTPDMLMPENTQKPIYGKATNEKT